MRQSARHRQASHIEIDWEDAAAKCARSVGLYVAALCIEAGLAARAASWRVLTAGRHLAGRIMQAAGAIRGLIGREMQIVNGYPVVTTRVILVAWALSFITTGGLPRHWFDVVTTLVRLGLSAVLLARWWRHTGQDGRQATRGRMGGQGKTPGPDVAVIKSLVEELQTTVAASNTRIESLTAALAEAFRAAGHEVPDGLAPEVTTGPMMRLMQGGRSGLAG